MVCLDGALLIIVTYVTQKHQFAICTEELLWNFQEKERSAGLNGMLASLLTK